MEVIFYDRLNRLIYYSYTPIHELHKTCNCYYNSQKIYYNRVQVDRYNISWYIMLAFRSGKQAFVYSTKDFF